MWWGPEGGDWVPGCQTRQQSVTTASLTGGWPKLLSALPMKQACQAAETGDKSFSCCK